MSESVSKALKLTGGPEAAETAEFVGVFDKFFDLLNVTNFTNGTRKRKPFQHPYRSAADTRLTVSNTVQPLYGLSILAPCTIEPQCFVYRNLLFSWGINVCRYMAYLKCEVLLF